MRDLDFTGQIHSGRQQAIGVVEFHPRRNGLVGARDRAKQRDIAVNADITYGRANRNCSTGLYTRTIGREYRQFRPYGCWIDNCKKRSASRRFAGVGVASNDGSTNGCLDCVTVQAVIGFNNSQRLSFLDYLTN